MKRAATPLLIPLILTWILDLSITLYFQDAAYWAGDYSRVEEDVHSWRLLMTWHPLLFVAGCIASIAFWSLIVVITPVRVGSCIAVLLTMSHGWAASNWLWIKLPYGGVIAFWFVQMPISVYLVYCLDRTLRRKPTMMGARSMIPFGTDILVALQSDSNEQTQTRDNHLLKDIFTAAPANRAA